MIKELIVVEGINDTKRLKSFFDVDTIETHGMGLGKDTIEFIRKANEIRGVILFLDPDTPGEKIRNRLNNEIPGLKNAFVMKGDAKTNKKVGIEHASKQVLEDALNNLVSYKEFNNSINDRQLYELGLIGQSNSSVLRERISKHFHIGKCNGKTMLHRLNMLGITYDDIVKVI